MEILQTYVRKWRFSNFTITRDNFLILFLFGLGCVPCGAHAPFLHLTVVFPSHLSFFIFDTLLCFFFFYCTIFFFSNFLSLLTSANIESPSSFSSHSRALLLPISNPRTPKLCPLHGNNRDDDTTNHL